MKHWNELTELETEIIRVGEFKNLFKLLVAGTENYVDIKVLQSAIYTMEGMIDDIDSTLYEKFQTVWNVVRDESFSEEEEEFSTTEEEFNFKFPTMDDYAANAYSTVTVPQTEYQGSTFHLGSGTAAQSPKYEYQRATFKNTSAEEDEAFKDLEKAIKNWHESKP
jgi:hypothetical protein